MTQLNKEHYAILREHVTPGSPQAQAVLGGLQERMENAGGGGGGCKVCRIEAALRSCDARSRSAHSHSLFHTLSLVFVLALLLMPLVRKVSAASTEIGGGH